MEKILRIRGGLYGLLIGDAVGVPYEFYHPSELPPREHLDMTPPAGFDRSHRRIAPGTWSDDGALALCLLESLLEAGGLHLADLARRFARWEEDGHLAVDQVVFDIGIQTRAAIARNREGVDPATSGPSGLSDNGNGSLMRVLPLALWHQGSDEELVQLAQAQSLVTHGHPVSQVCCALYVLVARHLLEGAAMADAWTQAERKIVAMRFPSEPMARAAEFVMTFASRRPKGSGFVVDSLWSAKYATGGESFEEVVKNAIALGHDTDTTACLAGGLAGIHFGFEGIPLRWREALRGRELMAELERQLLARVAE
jgi:ADP-ribosyl-[dinitrogen reductase] hydrolase